MVAASTWEMNAVDYRRVKQVAAAIEMCLYKEKSLEEKKTYSHEFDYEASLTYLKW